MSHTARLSPSRLSPPLSGDSLAGSQSGISAQFLMKDGIPDMEINVRCLPGSRETSNESKRAQRPATRRCWAARVEPERMAVSRKTSTLLHRNTWAPPRLWSDIPVQNEGSIILQGCEGPAPGQGLPSWGDVVM